jgi:hypothetical protein
VLVPPPVKSHIYILQESTTSCCPTNFSCSWNYKWITLCWSLSVSLLQVVTLLQNTISCYSIYFSWNWNHKRLPAITMEVCVVLTGTTRHIQWFCSTTFPVQQSLSYSTVSVKWRVSRSRSVTMWRRAVCHLGTQRIRGTSCLKLRGIKAQRGKTGRRIVTRGIQAHSESEFLSSSQMFPAAYSSTWRWRQKAPPSRWYLSTKLSCATFQTTVILELTDRNLKPQSEKCGPNCAYLP